MLLIKNIGCLSTQTKDGDKEDAAIIIQNEQIAWCGRKNDQPDLPIKETIDAQGCLVIPGLIDCHTHLLFAGSRADEFKRRMDGESYETIMEKGGGIQSSVNATRNMDDEQLLKLIRMRADAILLNGVTTLEAKSGYGLSFEQELRSLRLLKTLDENHPLDLHRTFLGAHVVPKEFKTDRRGYVNLLKEMLEAVAKDKLAVDCDVFCDKGAFTIDESFEILSHACNLGLGLRAHLHQLANDGAIALLNDLPIKSISHADFLNEEDLELLASHDTVVEILPLPLLFLRAKESPPVKKLLEKKIPLALATDFNPGSAMCHDLVLAARIGVTLCGFPIAYALSAITKNAAQSLGRDDIGKIERGACADIIVTNCQTQNEFFYDWTKSPVHTVLKRGKVVKS